MKIRNAFVALLSLAFVATAVPAVAASSASTTTHYEYPSDVQAARKVCFRAEREARDIPGGDQEYIAWWNANEGTVAQLDWTAAFDACKDANEVAGAKWSAEWYSNLVRK